MPGQVRLLYGFLIGAATGFVMARLSLKSAALRGDPRSVEVFGFFTSGGALTGLTLDYRHNKRGSRAFEQIMGDLEKVSELNLERLKGTRTEEIVNNLN